MDNPTQLHLPGDDWETEELPILRIQSIEQRLNLPIIAVHEIEDFCHILQNPDCKYMQDILQFEDPYAGVNSMYASIMEMLVKSPTSELKSNVMQAMARAYLKYCELLTTEDEA